MTMLRSLRLDSAGCVVGALILCLALCSRGLGAPASNVVPVIVRTPRGGFNRMVVSITLCAPGTTVCTTIPDVMLDTGSTGLRIDASALPPWLRLPASRDSAGKPLAECLRFVHDVAWGPLVRADLHLGGEVATDLPIQVVADEDQDQPAGCPRSTAQPTANGTLGLGPNLFDCADPCEQDPARPGVFAREAASWTPVRGKVATADRLSNPLRRLPRHNNGAVLDLPTPPPSGAMQLAGTLTLGVGTAANNRLGAARVVRLDGMGRFTTLYGDRSYPAGTIDSGTETNILADDELPRCAGSSWAFCAEPARQRDATIVGADGTPLRVPFTVGDYRAARERHVGASDVVAVVADPAAKSFVWGAPFFMGRRVFVVLDGMAVPNAGELRGPLYAIP